MVAFIQKQLILLCIFLFSWVDMCFQSRNQYTNISSVSDTSYVGS